MTEFAQSEQAREWRITNGPTGLVGSAEFSIVDGATTILEPTTDGIVEEAAGSYVITYIAPTGATGDQFGLVFDPNNGDDPTTETLEITAGGAASTRAQVRLLISDVGGTSGDDYIFNDDEIASFLEMEAHPYRAAALALRTLAGNEAMLFKRITILELKTDGPAVAKELRELAVSFDKRADDSTTSSDDEMYVVPMGRFPA